MGLSFSADEVCKSAIDFSAVLPVVWMEEGKPFILQRISCGFLCYGCFIGNIQVVQVASHSVEVVCLCCFGNEGAAG